MRYDEQLGQLPLVISVANQGDHGHKSRRLRQPTGIKIQIRRDAFPFPAAATQEVLIMLDREGGGLLGGGDELLPILLLFVLLSGRNRSYEASKADEEQ